MVDLPVEIGVWQGVLFIELATVLNSMPTGFCQRTARPHPVAPVYARQLPPRRLTGIAKATNEYLRLA